MIYVTGSFLISTDYKIQNHPLFYHALQPTLCSHNLEFHYRIEPLQIHPVPAVTLHSNLPLIPNFLQFPPV